MVLSGIRIGAWDYLQWKHVIPMTNSSGEIISTKFIQSQRRYNVHSITFRR